MSQSPEESLSSAILGDFTDGRCRCCFGCRTCPPQPAAAGSGDAWRGPLLIVAGAGTGKTTTLAHRVAHLISSGTTPGRILLLTFSRRASAEMLRRVDGILRELHRGRAEELPVAANAGAGDGSLAAADVAIEAASSTESPVAAAPELRGPSGRVWGGTFHSVGTRLLQAVRPTHRPAQRLHHPRPGRCRRPDAGAAAGTQARPTGRRRPAAARPQVVAVSAQEYVPVDLQPHGQHAAAAAQGAAGMPFRGAWSTRRNSSSCSTPTSTARKSTRSSTMTTCCSSGRR